jgi:hypothetical protein
MSKATDEVARATIEQIRARLREQRSTVRSAPRLSQEELLIRQTLADVALLYRTVRRLEKALTVAQQQFEDPFTDEYELAEEALQDAQETVKIIRAHWAQMPPKLRTGIKFEEPEAEEAE